MELREIVRQICIDGGMDITKVERRKKEPMSNERLEMILEFVFVFGSVAMFFGFFCLIILS